MRRTLVIGALVLFAVSASALTIEPRNPDTRSHIQVKTLPNWCWITPPKVTISGLTVFIDVDMKNGLCLAALVLPAITIDIGRLAAGSYEVITRGSGVNNERLTFEVRGVDPFRVVPPGAPAAGGTRVVIEQSDQMAPYPDSEFSLTPYVTIGGRKAEVVSSYPVSVIVPPHAPGLVDVTLSFLDTSLPATTVQSAFKYYDPNAAPDPFVFEPLLFPISYEGDGGYGSRWTTENVIYTKGGALFAKAPCPSCPLAIPCCFAKIPLQSNNSGSGQVVYVGRDLIGRFLTAWSQLRELSRGADRPPTELPVVLERDFVRSSINDSRLTFAGLPLDRRGRATLRAWSPDAKYVYAQGSNFSTPLVFDDSGFGFASIDITEQLAKRFPADPIFYVFAQASTRLWGVITITDYETQQVTVYTPRPDVP